MIDAVAPGDSAKSRQIEVRILDLERIKGPFDEVKSAGQRVVALRQLQTAAQAMIAPAVAHRQHVGMKIGVAGARAGNGEGKADEVIAVERADDLPTDLAADDEHAQRNQIDVIKIPDLLLQGDAGLKFLHAVAFANGDPI